MFTACRNLSERKNEFRSVSHPRLMMYANLAQPSVQFGIPSSLIDIETIVRGQGTALSGCRMLAEEPNEIRTLTENARPPMVEYANLTPPRVNSGIPPKLMDLETAVRGQGGRLPEPCKRVEALNTRWMNMERPSCMLRR